MDTKMISIVRIAGIIGIVLLIYLANAPSNGEPSIILFKLIFCGGGMFIIGFFWVKSEYMRSEYKREERKYIREKQNSTAYNGSYAYKKGNTFIAIITIISTLATILSIILTLTKRD